ncbi:MAG: T9SS type A sorting domain-containing protein [Taibaiella sp.]|nr:T9SS type A sorting domain-containing protein [Taibaiella sp.]
MKYITLLFASIFFITTAHSQVIVTVAGTGGAGFGGDGGPATSAHILTPYGVTVDKNGELYICDIGNRRIRKVTPAYEGVISTVAGNGTAGFSGDGFAAIYAQMDGAWDVALDFRGNVYFADGGNNRVRKISTSGIVTTYAGTGVASYNGDGIPATSANLNGPTSVCTDDTGNVYIVDRLNNRIRKVDTFGLITTIVGNGTVGFSPDGGKADTASVKEIWFARVDRGGFLFFCDNYRLRKINAMGQLVTIAGNGTEGDAGDGGPAIAAELKISAIALDTSGNAYIACGSSNKVRRVSKDGIINTVAGSGLAGYYGDGGNPLSAKLNGCSGVAVSVNGDIFISDLANHRIRMVTMRSVGLTEAVKENVAMEIYPNPAQEIVTIMLRSSNDIDAEASITTLDGKVVDTFCLRTNTPVTITTGWPTGTYTLSITADGKVYNRTFSIN